jgi:alpha-amylase/alpha-mannosidase (GH57 family)
MIEPGKMRHVCFHGHFYQPPRENPWMDAVELERSAAPHHDWNERITHECYRANAAARLVAADNRIVALRNNYQSMSFNFGPTLLRWMERHAPWVYDAIRRADQESCARHGGHGNAIAQAYGHLIMPLADRRDQQTQVIWGMKDFSWRFGRDPEGMWLPETAVSLETLRVLAECGIRFTILAPAQALRWRPVESPGAWHDAAGGTIPSGQAYRCYAGAGQSMDLFFYDARLAHGIAFGGLLEDSGRLLAAVHANHDSRGQTRSAWLVHVATDGESYGHHSKFGDMALAAAMHALERDPLVCITNYGAFLASHPPSHEVEIAENTAWSCAHGLGRWQRDCGCRIGGEPGWNQGWREPLREALNELRDQLKAHYERAMANLSRDPWLARDEYIEVILDRGQLESFVSRTARSSLSETERVRLVTLLEMQRSAMAMFTSCGWFFDEISGLETLLILTHAARAIQLAAQTGADRLEEAFLRRLAKAPSNRAEYSDGADVYRRAVKPRVVTFDRVIVNYAIQSVVRNAHCERRLHCFSVYPLQEEQLGPNPVPCLVGRTLVKDDCTLEGKTYLFAVMHFGGLDFRCSVAANGTAQRFDTLLRRLQQAAEEQNTVKMIRALDSTLGSGALNLFDCFSDLRQEVALHVAGEKLRFYGDFQKHLFEENRSLMWSLQQMGVALPSDLLAAVRRILTEEVSELVRELLEHDRRGSQQWPEGDPSFYVRGRVGRLRAVLREASEWGVELNLERAARMIEAALTVCLEELLRRFNSLQVTRLLRLVNLCRTMRVELEPWMLQTLYHELALRCAQGDAAVWQAVPGAASCFAELDDFLGCRFATMLPTAALQCSS